MMSRPQRSRRRPLCSRQLALSYRADDGASRRVWYRHGLPPAQRNDVRIRLFASIRAAQGTRRALFTFSVAGLFCLLTTGVLRGVMWVSTA
jgi:hypothetical protein